jgi:HIV Tat-specific factor 1
MYEDAQGNFTGSALLVFFKKESISNAITGQHNSWFRPEDAGSSSKNIRVMAADFSFKKNKDGDEIVSKMSRADKKASERVRAELNR